MDGIPVYGTLVHQSEISIPVLPFYRIVKYFMEFFQCPFKGVKLAFIYYVGDELSGRSHSRAISNFPFILLISWTTMSCPKSDISYKIVVLNIYYSTVKLLIINFCHVGLIVHKMSKSYNTKLLVLLKNI